MWRGRAAPRARSGQRPSRQTRCNREPATPRPHRTLGVPPLPVWACRVSRQVVGQIGGRPKGGGIMSEPSIGIVGGGRVTRILLAGWKRANRRPSRIVVSDIDAKPLAFLQTEFPSL